MPFESCLSIHLLDRSAEREARSLDCTVLRGLHQSPLSGTRRLLRTAWVPHHRRDKTNQNRLPRASRTLENCMPPLFTLRSHNLGFLEVLCHYWGEGAGIDSCRHRRCVFEEYQRRPCAWACADCGGDRCQGVHRQYADRSCLSPPFLMNARPYERIECLYSQAALCTPSHVLRAIGRRLLRTSSQQVLCMQCNVYLCLSDSFFLLLTCVERSSETESATLQQKLCAELSTGFGDCCRSVLSQPVRGPIATLQEVYSGASDQIPRSKWFPTHLLVAAVADSWQAHRFYEWLDTRASFQWVDQLFWVADDTAEIQGGKWILFRVCFAFLFYPPLFIE